MYFGHPDPELMPGAKNAVETCLSVRPGEHVALIADEASRSVAASIAAAIEERGAQYTGLLLERRAKAQLRAGSAAHILLPLVEEALNCFADAEKIRPVGNDDSILRWNRCVRLLESRPEFHVQHPGPSGFESAETPPVHIGLRRTSSR